MIQSIRIQNYKLFKDFTVEDLPRILLIGGKNSCGKSSLLEALFLPFSFNFATVLSSRQVYYFHGDFWFRSLFSNMNFEKPLVIEYKTKESEQKAKVKFEGIVDRVIPHIQYKPSGETRTLPILDSLHISYWENTRSKKPNWSNFLYTSENQFYYKEPNSLPPKKPVMFLPAEFLLTSGSAHIHFYSKLILEKPTYYKTFLKALKLMDPELQSLSILSPDQQLMIYGDTGKQKIPLSLMGGGINRLMSFLLAISMAESGVVFIDELENGFHHSVLPRVWEVITKHAKNCNTQIIATTHSYELIRSAIEGVPESLRSGFQYRRLERQKNSTFKTVDYDFNSLENAVSSNLETR